MAWGSIVAPTATQRPTPDSRRHRQLDGYTSAAILATVIFTVYQFCNVDHLLYGGTPAYTIFNSLDAAVPWFFVLAALRLFEPIARSVIDGDSRISVHDFLRRRAVQIMPAYYVAVAVVWFTRQPSLPGDWRDLVEHLTFTQVFDEKRIFYTNGPAWAISVGVIFCILLAALTAGWTRMGRRLAQRNHRIAMLGVPVVTLSVVSLAWKAWAFGVNHRSTTSSFTTWFGPAANLDNFAVGMTLALIAAAVGDTRRLGTHARIALQLLAVLILILAFAVRNADHWSAVYFSTLCSLGFGCLIASVVLRQRQSPPTNDSRRTIFAALSVIAYGTYLWHEPILLALHGWHGVTRQAPGAVPQDVAVVLGASIIAGWASHTIVERPARHVALLFKRSSLTADPTPSNGRETFEACSTDGARRASTTPNAANPVRPNASSDEQLPARPPPAQR